MKSRVGIFGGSFDPVHNGHLLLARDAIEQLGISRVVFVPARLSPHKLERPPSDPAFRLRLLEAAVAGEPGFSVDPLELEREGPSFAIDTVRAMREKFPGSDLYYFIGADNIPKLHTWKDIDELRGIARFAVFSRGDLPVPQGWPRLLRRVEISSTEIRSRIAAGASLRYMVPDCLLPLLEKPRP